MAAKPKSRDAAKSKHERFEDRVLRRMLETQPRPHKEDVGKRRAMTEKNKQSPSR